MTQQAETKHFGKKYIYNPAFFCVYRTKMKSINNVKYKIFDYTSCFRILKYNTLFWLHMEMQIRFWSGVVNKYIFFFFFIPPFVNFYLKYNVPRDFYTTSTYS